MRGEGVPVRFLRSVYVPEDETCFYLYEAASPEQAREAARRAALPFDGVVEAISESEQWSSMQEDVPLGDLS